MSQAALAEAIKRADGQTALVRMINELSGGSYTQAQVWNWLNRDKRVPPEAAPYIELATGVGRAQLCPDFPWSVLDSMAGGERPRPVECRTVST